MYGSKVLMVFVQNLIFQNFNFCKKFELVFLFPDFLVWLHYIFTKNIFMDDFIILKYCQDGEYAQFLKISPLEKPPDLSSYYLTETKKIL